MTQMTELISRIIYKFLEELLKESKTEIVRSRRYEKTMKKIMESYNSGASSKDSVRRVNQQVDNIKKNLKNQIDKQNDHAQTLMTIDERTKEMVEDAKQYRNNAREVHNAAWWLNKKYQILIGGTLLLISVLVILMVVRIF